MPYSTLYQNIQRILFGAIGLSTLYLPISAQAVDDISKVNTDGSMDTDSLVNHDDFISDNMSISNNNVTNDNDSAINNSTINNSQAMDSTTVGLINNGSDNKDQDTHKSKQKTQPTDNPTIAQSLERLAQLYELYPTDTDNKNDKDNGNNHYASSKITNTQSDSLDSLGIFNTTSNTSPNHQQTSQPIDNTDHLKNSKNNVFTNGHARCEGRWIYPVTNASYKNNKNNQLNSTDNLYLNSLHNINNTGLPIYALADYGYYDNQNYAELSGNVTIEQGPQHIQADKVIMDLQTGETTAQGQVLFSNNTPNSNQQIDTKNHTNQINTESKKEGLVGIADSFTYNSKTGKSSAHHVAFASIPMQAHGYAEQLSQPSDSTYQMKGVMFTTCPPTDRKWQIDAKSIDINTDNGRGEAHHSTFRIANIPVFYLPYFNFPIDERRSSGFLIPSASVNSDNGVELNIPYYFNLAPNYDATLNTHIYSNRNPLLTGNFRYLTKNYGSGNLKASFMAHDKKFYDKNRSSIYFDHHWASQEIDNLTADAIYRYVSDADYLSDFDTLGLSGNTLNLPRGAKLNYYNDFVDGEIKVETYQTLQAISTTGQAILDKDKPYSKLPQLTFNYHLPMADMVDISGVSDTAYFKKSINDGSEAEKSGVRLYNKLSASYPIERSWGYVKPEVNLQYLYTAYDQDSRMDNKLTKENGKQSVFVPQVSIDSGLHLSRTGTPFGWYDDSLGGYQLLNPRLKYVYTPYKNQNNIPNFNTRIASINYEQLFSDSWFLGHDRIQDLHALTPALNYRYIDAMGVTRFDGSIGEQFYLNDGQVTLSNSDEIFHNRSSGLVWDVSTQPYNHLWFNINGALTNKYDLNYVTTELRYQPSMESLFNVGFIKRQQDSNTEQQPLSALTASSIYALNDNWRIMAQGQYDHQRDKMLDTLVGVDYEDCCFGFAIYGRRYYNDLNLADKPNQAVMAEIRLNGFGNNRSRLTHLLSNKVLGFESVQTAWKK